MKLRLRDINKRQRKLEKKIIAELSESTRKKKLIHNTDLEDNKRISKLVKRVIDY